jgi:phage shock protein A
MTRDLEQLSRLIAALPPAPEAWVTAAQELPRARAQLDDLLARAQADAELRAHLEADLEAALAELGIQPTTRVVDEVRERMRSF